MILLSLFLNMILMMLAIPFYIVYWAIAWPYELFFKKKKEKPEKEIWIFW